MILAMYPYWNKTWLIVIHWLVSIWRFLWNLMSWYSLSLGDTKSHFTKISQGIRTNELPLTISDAKNMWEYSWLLLDHKVFLGRRLRRIIPTCFKSLNWYKIPSRVTLDELKSLNSSWHYIWVENDALLFKYLQNELLHDFL